MAGLDLKDMSDALLAGEGKDKILKCSIVGYCNPLGSSSPNYGYAVYDGEEIVASGVSSSPAWVKHDAGGYHTKSNFDLRYPNGWRVEFDF